MIRECINDLYMYLSELSEHFPDDVEDMMSSLDDIEVAYSEIEEG